MNDNGWTWVFARPQQGVIEHDHPDYEYWRESVEIDDWIADGAPPGEQPADPPADTVPTHLQLAVTKDQAGQLLGGKSVDWVDKHVIPHVATLKPSRSVLIPTAELERWLNANSGTAL